MDQHQAQRLMVALAESTIPEGGSLHNPFGDSLIVIDANERGVASFRLGQSDEDPEVFCVWEWLPEGKVRCHANPEASFLHG